MIIENDYLEDIQRIWNKNNKGYISYKCNQRSIKDKNMLKVVYKEGNNVCGYAVLYFEQNFCDLEGYPNNIKIIPDKVAYIWEIITDINHLREGVATNIYNYIKKKYEGYTIYSCINLSNIPSLKLHSKIGFRTIYEFNKNDEKYIMMQWKL